MGRGVYPPQNHVPRVTFIRAESPTTQTLSPVGGFLPPPVQPRETLFTRNPYIHWKSPDREKSVDAPQLDSTLVRASSVPAGAILLFARLVASAQRVSRRACPARAPDRHSRTAEADHEVRKMMWLPLSVSITSDISPTCRPRVTPARQHMPRVTSVTTCLATCQEMPREERYHARFRHERCARRTPPPDAASQQTYLQASGAGVSHLSKLWLMPYIAVSRES